MRYYFNLVHAHGSMLDKQGVEVAEVEELEAHVAEAVEELRREHPSSADDWKGWRLEVTNTSGAVVLTVNLDPL